MSYAVCAFETVARHDEQLLLLRQRSCQKSQPVVSITEQANATMLMSVATCGFVLQSPVAAAAVPLPALMCERHDAHGSPDWLHCCLKNVQRGKYLLRLDTGRSSGHTEIEQSGGAGFDGWVEWWCMVRWIEWW
jgi:hypothetical protein